LPIVGLKAQEVAAIPVGAERSAEPTRTHKPSTPERAARCWMASGLICIEIDRSLKMSMQAKPYVEQPR
jgi:hypothetical protein